MSDDWFRRADRQRGRGVEGGVRWLTARLRAGEVSPEQVQLAAWLGDDAAQSALEDRFVPPPQVMDGRTREWVLDTRAWLDRLRDLPYGEARLVVAVARRLQSVWTRVSSDPRPLEALAASEAWLLCPCDAHAETAGVRRRAVHAGLAEEWLPLSPEARTAAVLTAVATGLATGEPRTRWEAWLSDVELLRAAREELIPWLLGLDDPVRRRAGSSPQA